MLTRKNYRATIFTNKGNIDNIVKLDEAKVKEATLAGRLSMMGLYIHKNMLFLYMECIDQALEPEDILPMVTKELALWPSKDGARAWAYMYPIFWHDIPTDLEYWKRDYTSGPKTRIGRIAYLKPDKLFSYIYHHKALVDEGLIKGDRYQFIANHEDILFSYYEEPRTNVKLKRDSNEESTVIKEWIAADPDSHFDHELSGKDNFLVLPSLMTYGIDDLEL